MEKDISKSKITTCLWFDENAEEAVNFYISVIKDSKILNFTKYDENGAKASGRPVGSVMTISFEIFGQEFLALNGGPHFKFTPATSFIINCENQDEVDYYWEKLSEGGNEKAQQCGWLEDKFGLSWQIVPKILPELMNDSDSQKSSRVMKAMLGMKKIEIDDLKKAYENE